MREFLRNLTSTYSSPQMPLELRIWAAQPGRTLLLPCKTSSILWRLSAKTRTANLSIFRSTSTTTPRMISTNFSIPFLPIGDILRPACLVLSTVVYSQVTLSTLYTLLIQCKFSLEFPRKCWTRTLWLGTKVESTTRVLVPMR